MELEKDVLAGQLFEEDIRLTGVTEFGIKWVDFLSGKAPIPHEGARFNVSFEGFVNGPEITGKKTGVDYLEIRADGMFNLNLHAVITTEDGEKIAVHEDGILIPSDDGSATGRLSLKMKLTSASPKYQWVNKVQVWGKGFIDMERGVVKVMAFRS